MLELRCCRCVAACSGKSIDGIDERGRIATKYGLTDQIGWWVPAVPVDGDYSVDVQTAINEGIVLSLFGVQA
jgi:hypothetical protein